MIEAHELHKDFLLPRNRVNHAVRGVSLKVEPGEVYGLLGPNGAGKTTLLRLLGAIITPTSGQSTIDGINAQKYPEKARRRLGFLSGNTKLYRRLTPREIFHYFGSLYGMERDRIEYRIRELTALLDMDAFLEQRCGALSTGQLQRVSIARVLLHEPETLILDEPTLGLDIMSSAAILDFIARARDHGHAIIFSTHYMTEAELLCDRIGLIYRGKLLAEGPREVLCSQTGTDNLKDAFLKLAQDRGKDISCN